MPFPHQRRRGATVLFRRKVPTDLRDRFGCGEIVRSLGRVTSGEARRLTHHLWSQTEVAFMFVRRVPGMTREEIGKVVDATVSEFRDQVDLAIADVRPGVAKAWLDEPAQVAAGLVGAATLLDHSLARGDLKAMGDRARSYATDLLNKPVEPDGPDERRLARAMASALRDEMQGASRAFETLARERPKSNRVLIREVSEFEYTPEDLAILRAAKVGENMAHFLARLKPVADDTEAEPAGPQPQPQPKPEENATAGPNLRNAGKVISELWPTFCASKEAMKEWKRTEAISARTTLNLWIQLQGDKAPGAYTAGDISAFHQLLQQLPSKYYHNKAFRTIYEREGVLALIEKIRGKATQRLSDKTWNSHNSTLNAFFEWCATKGDALPKGTVSICKGEFVPIRKRRRNRTDDEARRVYGTDEIIAIYSAYKFIGCASERKWKQPGQLVFRDHRYWLTIINTLHGNRREEPVILRVKHVKKTASGTWYFNWLAPELAHLLKDVGSPRDVPLHRSLIALGFLQARVFGRDPEAPLFPEAVSHSEMARHAGPYGKWFGLFCDACGVDDPTLDTHAWRHTVVTRLLNAGVPHHLVEEIVGHESERRRSELGTYTHAASIELLKEMLDRLDMPIDVSALTAAVARSDEIDKTAAWPDLSDPAIRPKPRKSADD